MSATFEQLAAEYLILHAYHYSRRMPGYDYGSGQRVDELNRRFDALVRLDSGRAAEMFEHKLDAIPAETVAAAWQRVAEPRIRRIRRDVEKGWGLTRSRAATMFTWRVVFENLPAAVRQLVAEPAEVTA